MVEWGNVITYCVLAMTRNYRMFKPKIISLLSKKNEQVGLKNIDDFVNNGMWFYII